MQIKQSVKRNCYDMDYQHSDEKIQEIIDKRADIMYNVSQSERRCIEDEYSSRGLHIK